MSAVGNFDFNVLRALSTRARFSSLYRSLPAEILDANTTAILGWFDLYFKTYEDHQLIEPPSLMTLIRLRMPNQPEAMRVFENVITRLDEPIDETTLRVTVETIETLRMSGEAAAKIQAFQRGEEVDLVQELRSLVHTTQSRIERTSAAKWADADPLEYILAEADDSGLQFTLFPQLAEGLKGLRPGKNVAVAMPTDSGKTSLLCQIAVMAAEQAKRMQDVAWIGDRPLLYLVNEGTAEGITPRIYQTALHVQFNELVQLAKQGQLVPQYEAVVGRRDAIRMVNIHGLSLGQVYRIIEAHNPYMVISDMTGRIRAASNREGGKNDVSQVEEVWNAMRENAAILNFVHLGTVQVSAEGFDQLYPPLSALQDSKVGIQTTLDLCIMGGRMNAASMEAIRGISTPKNKLARSGKKSLLQFEAVFDPTRNLWSSGQTVMGAA